MWYLDLIDYFLSHVGEVFNCNFFKNFINAFLFFSFLWDPYNSNIDTLTIVPKVSEAFLSSLHSFLFICSSTVIFTTLFSSSLIHSSALVILLMVPSNVFLISVIVLFISVCLFFISSMSLVIVLTVLNASYIFSIIFSSFWSNFTIIILNSLSGRLLNSSSFIWSCEFPPCSFICVVFLFLFIIFFSSSSS